MAPKQSKYTEQEQPQTQRPAAEASAAEDAVAHTTDSTKAVAEPRVDEPEVDPVQGVQRSVRPMKGSQRRRSRAEMLKRPDWQMELTIRRRGRTAGTYDPHYISPSGVKYRSKISVEEALRNAAEPAGNPSIAPTAASGSGESADSANKRQRLEDEDQEADGANAKEDS